MVGLSGAFSALMNDAEGQARLDQMEDEEQARKTPGSLNAGWEYYFQWADKDHSAWSEAFQKAENWRREEEKLWRDYYERVYKDDYGWWKKVTMIALNAIQLWALWKQFRQQKEIADRTYEIANRVQVIAEEMFAFYKQVYYPQEITMNNQINGYFDNPYCANYGGTGSRFEGNVRVAFARAKASALRCSSSVCGGFSEAQMKQFEIDTYKAIGNARNTAYRYEETKKETKDNKWLELRMKWIQVGRNISEQGQNGVMKAFGTFSNFGADPGAALSTLLGTLSNTVGQMVSSPVAPDGNINKIDNPSTVPYAPYFSGVRMSGDLQPAKVNKTSNSKPSRGY